MRTKKMILFLLIVMVSFLSAGCWDSQDINEKLLALAIVTDRQEEEYVFYIEAPNVSIGQDQQAGSGGGKESYSILIGRGRSYADARRQLNAKSEMPVFLGTVQSLIITDKLARFGIVEYLLRLQSDAEYRKALHIVTTFEKPLDLLSASPANGASVGIAISDIIKTLEGGGKIFTYSLSDILEFIYSNTCYALANIDLRDGSLTYTGFTIIHDGKYLDFIPVEEARGLVWLLGNNNIERLYTVPFGEYEATVAVKMRNKEINPVYTDGELSIEIKLALESEVRYLSEVVTFDESMQDKVKETLEQIISQQITDTVNQSKALKCDYLQFKEPFRIKYPNELKDIGYLEAYLASTVSISVETSLKEGDMLDLSVEKQEGDNE
ncbi:MAG: Ger(x)C family spore germination protein [Christensenellales bacterium]